MIQYILVGVAGVLMLSWIYKRIRSRNDYYAGYLGYGTFLVLSLLFSELFSFAFTVLSIAIISFIALREYMSHIEIRLQDRIAVLGSYLLIPFQYWFVLTNWYGMFIIAIPVYGFLLIPLLIALGGRRQHGTVFSIGAINFGLFLFVFCIGHIAYLASFRISMPLMLIASVIICDLIFNMINRLNRWTFYRSLLSIIISLPFTILIAFGLRFTTAIPINHSLIIGSIIPILAHFGRLTGENIKHDIFGIDNPIFPSNVNVLHHLRSYFFAAPVVFHYIRYFIS